MRGGALRVDDDKFLLEEICSRGDEVILWGLFSLPFRVTINDGIPAIAWGKAIHEPSGDFS